MTLNEHIPLLLAPRRARRYEIVAILVAMVHLCINRRVVHLMEIALETASKASRGLSKVNHALILGLSSLRAG